jgi:RNA polymerase sigma-70 factor (sigma-E family)
MDVTGQRPVHDDAEFDEFVDSVSARLVRAGWLLVGDRGTAEDLTQETLVRVYRHWSRIREPAARGAYAHRTLVRLARRQRRRTSSRLEMIGIRPVSDELAAAPDESEAGDQVRQAQLVLPPRQREALVLRYFLVYSVETTAAAMGCTPGTVKSQTSKGLAALRTLLIASDPPTIEGAPAS